MKQERTQQKNRPRWLGAAVAVGVLAALVIMALLVRTITVEPNEQANPAEENAHAPASEAAPEVDGLLGSSSEDFAYPCQAELSTDAGSVEDKAPEVDEWVSAGYNVVPMSTDFGGCEKRDSGLRVGYAHTPAGALMAAANYAVVVDPSGTEAQDSIKAAVAEGPDRDELLDRAEQISSGSAPATDPAAMRSAEFVGYDVREASKDRASFNIYMSFDNDAGVRQQAVGQVDLVWENGDWRVEPASGQQLMTVDFATTSPSVTWGP